MSQPIRACGGHLGFLIGSKNTILVEGIEYLLPVRFGEIPCSGFRGEVENVKKFTPDDDDNDDDDDDDDDDGRRTDHYDNSSLELCSGELKSFQILSTCF